MRFRWKPASRRRRRFNRFLLIVSSVAGLLSVVAVWRGSLDPLESLWQDRMHVLRGMRAADPRIVLITIDEKSIEEIGRFPWPRSTYLPLIRGLKRLGARVIGFDVLFLEPSLPEEDRALVDATRRAGNVIHALELDEKQINEQLSHFFFRPPFGTLAQASLGLGLVYVGFCLDEDGSIRTIPVGVGARRQGTSCHPSSSARLLEDPGRVPAFGTAVLAAFEGLPADTYLRRHGAVIRINYAGERSWQEPHPSGARIDGRPLMLEKREFGFARISAVDVIRDRLAPADRERLKGAMALIGSTAVGAYDHYPTPFSQLTPGLEVHANLIDNLIQSNHLREPPQALALAVPLFMVGLATLCIRLSPVSGSALALGATAAWVGFSYLLFLRCFLLPTLAPIAALGSAYFVLLTQRVLYEQRSKRWIRNTFAQYLSPKVIEVLTADPTKLKLGGDKREVSVFFLDIAGFTSISERMDPEGLTHFLNRYLTTLTQVVLKNDGVVDKYIGDCIMAFWNAPVDQPRHRELACLSALECVHAIEGMNAELMHSGVREGMYIRVGVNTGHAVVGNLGSQMRFSYTVIGDAVNVASRLEAANKLFGTHIMVSEDSLRDCREAFEARELGLIRVFGKNLPVRVFELLALRGGLPSNRARAVEAYHEGLDLYRRRRFADAAKQFAHGLKLIPEDRAASFYAEECRRLRRQPPVDGWDGTLNLTTK